MSTTAHHLKPVYLVLSILLLLLLWLFYAPDIASGTSAEELFSDDFEIVARQPVD